MTFDDIISVENLCLAWEEFIPGKRQKLDVQKFARNLGDEIVSLNEELASGTYRHGPYRAFAINDPKPRQIHKASVRDRLLHHAIHRQLYPIFARQFIADSYSCQVGKGTHRAMQSFQQKFWRVSRNDTRTCWVLKCDIRKFFASIDHELLIELLRRRIHDVQIIGLIGHIISSFEASPDKGIPLGNLTSQLFSNVYMHAFDRFVMDELKVGQYIRYADDFVILFEDRKYLEDLLPVITSFLHDRLALELHPDKVSLRTFASGVDFLGWLHFPKHRSLRAKTKHRMFLHLRQGVVEPALQSYLGLLSHGDTHDLRTEIENRHWLNRASATASLEQADEQG